MCHLSTGEVREVTRLLHETGVLLFIMTGVDNEVTAEEIENLRRHVRKEHKDVRANNRVVATLWDFIEEVQDRQKFYDKAESGTSKRKRDLDDGDDEDYKATPIRKLGVAPRRRKNGQ